MSRIFIDLSVVGWMKNIISLSRTWFNKQWKVNKLDWLINVFFFFCFVSMYADEVDRMVVEIISLLTVQTSLDS